MISCPPNCIGFVIPVCFAVVLVVVLVVVDNPSTSMLWGVLGFLLAGLLVACFFGPSISRLIARCRGHIVGATTAEDAGALRADSRTISDPALGGSSAHRVNHNSRVSERARRKEGIQGARLDELAPEVEFGHSAAKHRLERECSGFGEDEDTCAVCLEALEADTLVRTLPCHHTYHSSCIAQWLTRHVTCPLCNLNLLEVGPHNAQSQSDTRGGEVSPAPVSAELSEVVVGNAPSAPRAPVPEYPMFPVPDAVNRRPIPAYS